MKEPLLLTFCSATAAAAAAVEEKKEEKEETPTTGGDSDPPQALKGKANTKSEIGPTMKLDPELYEGIVSQPIIEPTVSKT